VLLALLLPWDVVLAQAACIKEAISYQSSGLTIKGQLARPAGPGPFPVVIDNHGSRLDNEAAPTIDVSRPLCPLATERFGAVTIFPERRGYGGSDGPRYSQVLRSKPPGSMEQAQTALQHLRSEADDVIAIAAFLRGKVEYDLARVVVAGSSVGGIVTFWASGNFPIPLRGVIAQALGFECAGPRGWTPKCDLLVDEMNKAAGVIKVPIFFQHASNDRQVPFGVSQRLYAALLGTGRDVQLRSYVAPDTLRNARGEVEGHWLFTPQHAAIWWEDYEGFLRRVLGQ